MAAFDALAPANVEAEQAVLGSLLIDTGAVVRCDREVELVADARRAHAELERAIGARLVAKKSLRKKSSKKEKALL